MSQLKEILEKEKERGSLEQCAVIHLFREGTFYRAYEWSAWLCVSYFTELRITHRHHAPHSRLSHRAAFTHGVHDISGGHQATDFRDYLKI